MPRDPIGPTNIETVLELGLQSEFAEAVPISEWYGLKEPEQEEGSLLIDMLQTPGAIAMDVMSAAEPLSGADLMQKLSAILCSLHANGSLVKPIEEAEEQPSGEESPEAMPEVEKKTEEDTKVDVSATINVGLKMDKEDMEAGGNETDGLQDTSAHVYE